MKYFPKIDQRLALYMSVFAMGCGGSFFLYKLFSRKIRMSTNIELSERCLQLKKRIESMGGPDNAALVYTRT